MTRADAFALMMVMIGLALLNIAIIEAKPTNNGLPLVRADFPLCVNVKPEPLLRTPHGRMDKRLDPNAFNDKGYS